jgi:hypothetical protein
VLGAFFMLKFVDMNTPKNDGAISLKVGMLEVEGWKPEFYQSQFYDFLDQQPYIVGTLMDADEGMDEEAHSWMLKAVLILKWSFQKMGWRTTMLGEEKWVAVLEQKTEEYETHQQDNGLDTAALIKLSGSPNTLSELYLYVTENNPADPEAAGNILFLLDCAIEALEMAVLQDKTNTDA